MSTLSGGDIVSYVGMILSPLAAVVVVKLQNRQADRAARMERETRAVEERRQQRRDAVEELTGLVETYRVELARDQTSREQDRARIERLERQRSEDRARIEKLEQRITLVQRVFRVSVAYIQRLLDFIAEHLPGHPDVPPTPPDLLEHLPTEVLEDWRIPPPTGKDH